MKLKLVVASMSVLGLISCPALAATNQKHTHHVAKHQVSTARTDYKDMGALPVEVCPITDSFTTMMDEMGQNVGRAKPNEGCHKLLSMAGGVNFDAKWGNRSMGYQGENTKRLSLNDAYLNLYGNITDWSKAFASISYNNASETGTTVASVIPTTFAQKAGQYSNVYPVDRLNLEQGYALIGNFDQSPLFLKLGKFFQDFGRYQIHPITRSTTQVLSESLQTAAQVGFVTRMGFHGDIYAFDNPLKARNAVGLLSANGTTTAQGHNTTDYGVALGFDQISDQLSFGINLGYLYNMVGVNDVAQAVSQYQSGNVFTSNGSYYNRVSAGSVDAYVGSGPFSLMVDYVSALKTFNNNDLGSKGLAAVPTVAYGKGGGAKPWAGNIQAGYGFNGWGKNQNLYLGYQASGDAVAIFLPKSRWVVGYNVDMWKNTNIGVQLDHDKDYSLSQGGTGNNSNLISLRAGVKFG